MIHLQGQLNRLCDGLQRRDFLRIGAVATLGLTQFVPRAAWQYLGTRHENGVLEWPIDAFHCDRCERSWERAG